MRKVDLVCLTIFRNASLTCVGFILRGECLSRVCKDHFVLSLIWDAKSNAFITWQGYVGVLENEN